MVPWTCWLNLLTSARARLMRSRPVMPPAFRKKRADLSFVLAREAQRDCRSRQLVVVARLQSVALSWLEAGVLGFEPRNAWTKTRCLTTWLHPSALANFAAATAVGNVPPTRWAA